METAVRLLARLNLDHRFNLARLRSSTPLRPALDLALDLQAMNAQSVNTERMPEEDSRRNNHLRDLDEEGFEGRGLSADSPALQSSCPDLGVQCPGKT